MSELLEATDATIEELNGNVSQYIIVPNPKLEPKVTTTRFRSASWFDRVQTLNITLIGVGGIGSWAAVLLGRIRPKRIFIYDDDAVELVNMAGQFYSASQLGKLKVEAVSSSLNSFCEYYTLGAVPEKFNINKTVTDIVICGLDNMFARKEAFHAWKKHIENYDINKKRECLFIDARLSAEEFQVFAMRGSDEFLMNKYEDQWLFLDREAETTLCSYKQTTYAACMVASIIVNILVNHAHNIDNEVFIRELPFFTRYDATTMIFKTSL